MKLLVFDGNSIINRAFYAIKNLSASDGTPTNAIFGFLKLYFKYLDMSSPDMVAVAFDVRAKTFRHRIYDGYKAQRKGMPEELAVQLSPLKEILSAMNVKTFELEGYEADDIIGTLSDYCTKKGYLCDIVSGDRDDFQLVNDNVRVIMPVTRGGMSEVEIYGRVEINEKYGLTPDELIELKAVMGDTSDNIKGVPGIGEKGAVSLIQSFKSLDGVYDNLDSDSLTPAIRKKLIEGRESAYLSLKLATIDKNVPIEIIDGEMTLSDFDDDRLLSLLERYELSDIINRLGLTRKRNFVISRDAGNADTEKYYDYFKNNGLCFLTDGDAILADTPDGIARITDYDALLTDDGIEKITYSPKPLYRRLLESNSDVKPFYDIEVAQYVLNPSTTDYSPQKTAKGLLDIDIEDNDSKAVVSVLARLAEKQRELIKANGQDMLLYDVELPLTVVLADMENCGFSIDVGELARYSKRLADNITALENRIYMLAGEKFNINSPQQLGIILFDKLGLPHGKKTKTGYSTNADILGKLSGKHEIVDEILEYRRYAKLKSTYCDGLSALVDDSGKIHTSFNQTVTQTGRISSAEPNLQNIPVRTELGRELRAMFVSGDDSVLLDADYSQIELRVLAHIANDRAMLDAFSRDEDIHAVTAASVFGVPQDFVTPEMRRAAKAVNFGIVYGISDFSLAQDIKTTKAQAARYIEGYLGLYSGVRDYMKNVVERARTDGYVTTMYGRRRYLPELASKNHLLRSFGERAAMNTPIQGTAADIIKIAMVNTRRALIDGGYKAKLILQVHDELIIEAPENEREEVSELLGREMENAVRLNVRLKADVQWGRSWYECK